MNLGVCTISNTSRDVVDLIEHLGETEATGIEVWGRDHIGDDGARTGDIAAAAAVHDLEIPVYGSYLRAGSDTFERDVDRELRIASELDADLIRVWAGDANYDDVASSDWDRIVSDLRTLAEEAERWDVEVTVERHDGTVTDRRAGATRLMDETPSAVGLNWQPLFRHDAETVREDIEALAPLSNNVHLQAVAEPGEHERCPLAFAYFDVPHVLETLDSNGFDGYVEIEFVSDRVPYEAALAADMAVIEALH